VAVPEAGNTASAVRAGTLPVRAAGARLRKGATPAKGASATRVRVSVADRAAAQRAGVDGILVSLARTDTGGSAAPTKVEVDYSTFRDAYGADWSSRLHLAVLPACSLTTPDAAGCRKATPLATDNDTATHLLTATVTLQANPAATSAAVTPTGGAVVLAATAGDGGADGSFKATSLAPSGSWSAGGNSGGFAWNVPIDVPPVPGSLAPKVALNYNSSSVDGRTASTNNQSSWIGEGWDYSPGYVERSYASCENDKQGGNNTAEVGDLCWKSQNATLSLNGSSNELVWDAGKGVWRLASDDGSRIEQIFSSSANAAAGEGDDDNEYWRLTTQDGTQYWFGKNRLPGWSDGKPETNSVFTVPVFGNHSGEPGHGSTFASSAANQGWRWNLDYVVDPHGNAMTLYYTKEAGYYAKNLKPDAPAKYTRGGYLNRIDYGLRAGAVYTTDNPAGRVTFDTAERCLSSCTTFDHDHATNWPDVPVDLDCTASSTDCQQSGPSFWTRKRLTGINSFALSGTTMTPVDTWTLGQSFPPTGDTSSPTLWLDSVQRTAKAGALADITLPKTTFEYDAPMANRVNSAVGRPPLYKYRLQKITNETGGQTLVTYSPIECTASSLPTAQDTNNKRCYPSWWTPDGAVDPVKDWFHKYVVQQVVEDDTTAGNGSESTTTTYQYNGGPNWRRDTSEFTLDKHRTWNDYRGYSTVRTLVGAANRTQSETSYFTGMYGDTMADGSPRPQLTVNGVPDRLDFSGQAAETRTYDQENGKVVAKTTFVPWQSDATATQAVTGITDPDKPTVPGPTLPAKTAHYAGVVTQTAGTLMDNGTWRNLVTTRTYDPVYGLVTSQSDDGDPDDPDDSRCTRTDYVTPDTANWLINYSSQSTTVHAAVCDRGILNSSVTAITRTFYDGKDYGAAPDPGKANVTEVQQAPGYDSSGPTWESVAQTDYDDYGRVTSSAGQDGQTTTTAYSPTAGAQPTSITVTDAAQHQTVTTQDGLRGLTLTTTDPNGNVTTSAYDSVGRLTQGWSAGRPTTANPNATYTYTLSSTVPSTVTTKNLYENGLWGTSTTWYDSLLRERQTQSDAVGVVGRTITDTFYDSLGRAYRTNNAYYNSTPVSSVMFSVPDNQVPNTTVTEYDGRSRPTAVVTLSLNVEKWRSTTTHGDTWTATLPVAGDTATLAINDIRGRTVERREYKDRNPVISAARTQYEKTSYAYDSADRLINVTDNSGRNTWTYGYDLRGRQISASDPDAGASSTTYGTDGRVATTTDARGVTLATTYDALGRQLTLRTGSVTGPKLAEWTYDTAPGGKGLPATTTRYDTSVTPTAAYTTTISGYDAASQPTGTTLTVPSVTGEEKLAGTYTVAATNTPVSELPATTTFSTTNTNATTALPAETVTDQYGSQNLLNLVDGNLKQVYLRGAGYTEFGELAQAQLGNLGTRVIHTLTYDTVTRRLATSVVDRETSGPQTLSNIKYSYDTAGNLTRARDDQNDNTVVDDQCYTYDWARRLTDAWTTGDACATKSVNGVGTPSLGATDPYWTSWTFTDSNDRASETQHKAGPIPADTTSTYTYPTATGAAQAHAVRTVTTTSAGTTVATGYQYDAAGDLTQQAPSAGAVQDLTWTPEGNLATSTTAGAGTTSFVYDTAGTRLIKREPTATTIYLPGGQELTLTKATGTVTGTRYYTVPGGSAVRTSTDGKVRLLVADPHGTNTLSISATNLAVNRRKTLPYGAPRGTAPAFWPGQKGFVNGDTDPTTGFTHIGARDYDPTTGRFISVDPLLQLDQPQTIGGYDYSANNPTTYSDPTGTHQGGATDNIEDQSWRDVTKVEDGGCGGDCDQTETWVDQNTPVTSDGKALQTQYALFSPNQHSAGDYWHPVTNAFHNGPQNICFGLKGCQKAASYLLHNKGDIAGARLIAATYCLKHMHECQLDEEVWAAGSKNFSEAPFLLAGGEIPELGGADMPSFGEADLSELFADESRITCTALSFSPDTPVLMEDGKTKPIGTLKPGDRVEAADPDTGKHQGPRTVTATHLNHDDDLIDLTVETAPAHTETLHTTSRHPFWDDTTHTWVPAGHLTPGHNLETARNTHVRIAAIHVVPGAADMYNLTVNQLHTYYVLAGTTPVLVHNCSAPSIRISPAVSDWATKGAHIHVGSSEVRVFPTGDGGVGFEGLRMSNGMASARDVETARKAIMGSPELRADLIDKARSAMADMNDHNWGNSVNRAPEMNFLIKALGKIE
jgi:RHS repeat-associated protein